jgi:hypothetical protein
MPGAAKPALSRFVVVRSCIGIHGLLPRESRDRERLSGRGANPFASRHLHSLAIFREFTIARDPRWTAGFKFQQPSRWPVVCSLPDP